MKGLKLVLAQPVMSVAVRAEQRDEFGLQTAAKHDTVELMAVSKMLERQCLRTWCWTQHLLE